MKKEIHVIFELPDDSQVEEPFMLGHTIEVLKAFLAADCDFDFQTIKLQIGSKTLLDPMQLADYVSGEEEDADVYVTVEGEFEGGGDDTGRK